MRSLRILPLLLVCFACAPTPNQHTLLSWFQDFESIAGTDRYLGSPYVTAGDRLYMVGHQDGSFPDLGWHVTGEMGGIWNHPIKLMDGFAAQIEMNGDISCLNEASQFVNYPLGNVHYFELENLSVTRSQFVPDMTEGVYLEYELTNNSATEQELTFHFNGMIDLMPVWLGERTQMIDGPDQAHYDASIDAIVGKDQDNEWYVVYKSVWQSDGQTMDSEVCNFNRKGQGVNAALSYQLTIPRGESIVLPFAIAGSDHSLEEAKTTLSEVLEKPKDAFDNKATRYRAIEHAAKLTIPDKKMEQAFRWVKYNTDWLIRDVDGLGRGVTAGIPDYPWYFGADSEYALQGAAAIGMTDLVENTIALIDSVSNAVNNNSGKIMHEMSTNGAVFNPGNLNETPQYPILVWNAFRWTGDMAFLKKYYPTVKAGLKWLLEENDEDGNMLADGYGMMEIHGLESEMIDVAAYTYAGNMAAAQMAEVLGYLDDANRFKTDAAMIKPVINEQFWADEFDSYADFIGTAKDAEHLIEGAIIRADTLDKPWAVEELKATQKQVASFAPNEKKGFVLYHNWVVNTPLEMGIADKDKAIRALNTGSKYVNPFGVFVTGIDRDKSAESDDGGFAERMKIFSYTGAVMTLPTGVQAIAENNYGRPNEALDYLERMTNSFSYALPGSMYEVSPDFGMIVQAWNIYSYAIPIITQFFGVQPYAHKKEIHINPQMPDKWTEGSIENIKVGNNSISLWYKKDPSGKMKLIIEQSDPTWKIFTESSDKVLTGEKIVIE